MKAIRTVVLAAVVGSLALALPGAASAAPKGGKIAKVDSVRANETDVYQMEFVVGVATQVHVVGDGDTDLDLFVYDPLGREVANDVGPTDNCYVRFTPTMAGKYTIKIKNLGGVFNRYALVVK
jgi:hypothetical protein